MPSCLVRKVMHADLFGGAFRTPLTARVPEVPYQFLLLGAHQNHRLPGRRKRRDLAVDVVEPGIPVRMIRAIPGLHVALKRVPLFRNKP